MSYKEFTEATTQRQSGSEAPLLGAYQATMEDIGAGNLKKDTKLAMRYFIANMSDEGERQMAEHIMTVSLNCANELKKMGDISVFREDYSFDKSGNYLVAIKYCEVIPAGGIIETARNEQIAEETPSIEEQEIELPGHDF